MKEGSVRLSQIGDIMSITTTATLVRSAPPDPRSKKGLGKLVAVAGSEEMQAIVFVAKPHKLGKIMKSGYFRWNRKLWELSYTTWTKPHQLQLNLHRVFD